MQLKTVKLMTVGALIAILAACSPSEKEKKSEEAEITAKPVKVISLKKDSINKTLEYTANITAFEEVNYAPAQPGRIQKIFVDAGDHVRKGQLLVKMDKTQLTQALSQLENARTTFERMDTLYKLNSISKQQYDQAKTQYEVAASNLEYLEKNTTLTSPFNGIVTAKYFEGGEVYSGTPNTQAGKAAIITLMQINPLKAIVSIPENYFPHIKTGMSTTITTDIYPGKSFSGNIYKIHPTIDPSTRSFKVEIKIDNPGEKLRPGMFARVILKLGQKETLMAPAIATLKQEGTNNRFVFINKNGIAHKIEVKIGKRLNDQVELISDELSEGQELIVTGQVNLMHNDTVIVKK